MFKEISFWKAKKKKDMSQLDEADRVYQPTSKVLICADCNINNVEFDRIPGGAFKESGYARIIPF